MQFAYTIVYVADVAAAIGFYEHAFGFSRKMITPEADYAELDTGQTTLSFAHLDLARSHLPEGFISTDAERPLGMEIAFVCDDVSGALQKAVDLGAQILSDPKTTPWGQTIAYCRCPAGVLIELCTAVNTEP